MLRDSFLFILGLCCITLSFQVFPYLFANDCANALVSEVWHGGLSSERL